MEIFASSNTWVDYLLDKVWIDCFVSLVFL